MVQRASGTYRDGHVELNEPVDWEEGMRVSIESEEGKYGMDEAEWPTDQKGIEEHIARIKALKPLNLTPEELKEIEDARAAVREYTINALKKEWGL